MNLRDATERVADISFVMSIAKRTASAATMVLIFNDLIAAAEDGKAIALEVQSLEHDLPS